MIIPAPIAWIVPASIKKTSPFLTETLFKTSSRVLFSIRCLNSSLEIYLLKPKYKKAPSLQSVTYHISVLPKLGGVSFNA